ncbi:MAG TPA: cyclophilin-like fold protein [Planctomycetota bacterium]|nr:cyclophilin-like fold protein [Planctomycetota bacterium]
MSTRPRKRSPVPRPGFIMGKTSYDRAAQKEALEAEADAFLREKERRMKKMRITAGKVTMDAELSDSATAGELWAILPVESSAQTWGREVYFKIPMHHEPENAQAKVPAGTVAFWPEGDCLCVFFGQTPYSPVNVVGTLAGDPNAFEKVRDGDAIHIEKVE